MSQLEQDLDLLLKGVDPSSALRVLHFAARLISHGSSPNVIAVPWIAGANGEPTETERLLAYTIVTAAKHSADKHFDSKKSTIEALAQYALKISTDRWGTGGRADAMDYLSRCRQPEFDMPDPDPKEELRIWSNNFDAFEDALQNLAPHEKELIRLRLSGKTWTECVNLLGYSEWTLRTQWSRILRKLRNVLAHQPH